VRLGGATTHLGTAIDPAWVKTIGGPAIAIDKILDSCGEQAVGNIEGCRFSGTPALTRRRRRLAEQGLFVLGDAAGYVEPFTGEGIGWALESAEEVAGLAAAAIAATADMQNQLSARWQARQNLRLRHQQWRCRCVRGILHRPWMAGAAMAGLSVGLVRSVVESGMRSSSAASRAAQEVGPDLAVARGRI
jgi:2-polyprenyl-6-methoxyphenol hydroxylase-like FAD-dependent oxidoreductase